MHPRHPARLDVDALETELETALLNAMMGDPWGPSLAGRLEMVARAILLRHRLDRAKIYVRGGRRGVEVEIRLPPAVARVESIRLNFG